MANFPPVLLVTGKGMKEDNVNKCCLSPIGRARVSVPSWNVLVLNKVLTWEGFGGEADGIIEGVEKLRREQPTPLLSMTVQGLHDETVVITAWTLPSGTSAYLVEKLCYAPRSDRDRP